MALERVDCYSIYNLQKELQVVTCCNYVLRRRILYRRQQRPSHKIRQSTCNSDSNSNNKPGWRPPSTATTSPTAALTDAPATSPTAAPTAAPTTSPTAAPTSDNAAAASGSGVCGPYGQGWATGWRSDNAAAALESGVCGLYGKGWAPNGRGTTQLATGCRK